VFDELIGLLRKDVKDSFSGSNDIFLTDLRDIIDIRKAFEANLIAFSEQVEQRRSCVQSHQEGISLKEIHDLYEFSFGFYSGMWEDNFTLKTAVLTAYLELFGLYFNNIEVWIFLSDKFDGFGHLLFIGHGG
jgi:hypothetical protein